MSRQRNEAIRIKLIDATNRLEACQKFIREVHMPQKAELDDLREKHKALSQVAMRQIATLRFARRIIYVFALAILACIGAIWRLVP